MAELPGVEELLVQCVLDSELLRRVRETPEAVFSQYDLSPECRSILESPDHRFLELLGDIAHRQMEISSGNEETDSSTASEATMPSATETSVEDESHAGDETEPRLLPESRVAVRLVPYVQETSAQEPKIQFVAQLDPLVGETEMSDLADIPQAAVAGQRLPPLGVVLQVRPQLSLHSSGHQQISFSLEALQPDDAAGASQPSADRRSERLGPWNHETDSPEVLAAAKLVHEADDANRYDRVLDLVKIMVQPVDPSRSPQ